MLLALLNKIEDIMEINILEILYRPAKIMRYGHLVTHICALVGLMQFTRVRAALTKDYEKFPVFNLPLELVQVRRGALPDQLLKQASTTK